MKVSNFTSLKGGLDKSGEVFALEPLNFSFRPFLLAYSNHILTLSNFQLGELFRSKIILPPSERTIWMQRLSICGFSMLLFPVTHLCTFRAYQSLSPTHPSCLIVPFKLPIIPDVKVAISLPCQIV